MSFKTKKTTFFITIQLCVLFFGFNKQVQAEGHSHAEIEHQVRAWLPGEHDAIIDKTVQEIKNRLFVQYAFNPDAEGILRADFPTVKEAFDVIMQKNELQRSVDEMRKEKVHLEGVLPTIVQENIQKVVREKIQALEGEIVQKIEQLNQIFFFGFPSFSIRSRTDRILKQESMLSWCECDDAPRDIRFDLISQLTFGIQAKYPDKSQHLTIVSLASGDLLQEYLILRALFDAGYTSISFIAIDPKYKISSNLKDIHFPYFFGLTKRFEKIGVSIVTGKHMPEPAAGKILQVIPYQKLEQYYDDLKDASLRLEPHALIMVDADWSQLPNDFFLQSDMLKVEWAKSFMEEERDKASIKILRSPDREALRILIEGTARREAMPLDLFRKIATMYKRGPDEVENLSRLLHERPHGMYGYGLLNLIRLNFYDLIRRTCANAEQCIAYELNDNRIADRSNFAGISSEELLDRYIQLREKGVWVLPAIEEK